MAENNGSIVTRLFTDPAEAVRVELVRAGCPAGDAEVALQAGKGTGPPTNIGPRELRSRGGAALGGIVGGMTGSLLGTLIATGTIPIVGPILDGAGLAGIVGGLAGLAVGGLLGALIGWGFMSNRVGFAGQELRSAHTLMAVYGNGRASEAAILRHRQAAPVKASADTATGHTVASEPDSSVSRRSGE
jgi:hypothetical protein